MSIAAPGLIQPHGGSLVDLMLPADQRETVRTGVDRVVECSDRNACDVELLVVGGFSPLRGFMHQEDYEAVVANHRSSSGLLFGLPIVFDTADPTIAVGDRLLLTYRGQDLAVFTVESRWEPDKVKEAKGCYGTTSLEHPAVRMIATERGHVRQGAQRRQRSTSTLRKRLLRGSRLLGSTGYVIFSPQCPLGAAVALVSTRSSVAEEASCSSGRLCDAR